MFIEHLLCDDLRVESNKRRFLLKLHMTYARLGLFLN